MSVVRFYYTYGSSSLARKATEHNNLHGLWDVKLTGISIWGFNHWSEQEGQGEDMIIHISDEKHNHG